MSIHYLVLNLLSFFWAFIFNLMFPFKRCLTAKRKKDQVTNEAKVMKEPHGQIYGLTNKNEPKYFLKPPEVLRSQLKANQ